MAYRVIAASWPRPLGGIYVTMLCSLHLIIKQHVRRRICIVCEKRRDQETQVLGAVTCCVVLYLGRDELFGDGGWGKIYITTVVGSYLKHLHYSAPVTVCSIHQYDEVGIERYGQRATLINGACCSNLSSSIIKLTWFCGVEERMNVEVYQTSMV